MIKLGYAPNLFLTNRDLKKAPQYSTLLLFGQVADLDARLVLDDAAHEQLAAVVALAVGVCGLEALEREGARAHARGRGGRREVALLARLVVDRLDDDEVVPVDLGVRHPLPLRQRLQRRLLAQRRPLPFHALAHLAQQAVRVGGLGAQWGAN